MNNIDMKELAMLAGVDKEKRTADGRPVASNIRTMDDYNAHVEANMDRTIDMTSFFNQKARDRAGSCHCQHRHYGPQRVHSRPGQRTQRNPVYHRTPREGLIPTAAVG